MNGECRVIEPPLTPNHKKNVINIKDYDETYMNTNTKVRYGREIND